ncbi:hypothetical protein FJZ53_04850 [Candidatus Woesearchaeota archaeon]|nr:hypothetical protein [Candidatus Woesearchaeota archaeon]
MKLVKRTVSALLGLGLLFGISNTSLPESKFQRFEKDGFALSLGTNEEMKRYSIEVKTIQKRPVRSVYDGDVDYHFMYYANHISCATGKNPTEYDKNGDGWIKVKNKWKKVGDGMYRSNETTGSVISDVTYDDVPGSPKIDKEVSCKFRVDFDENEEYAAGIFTNKKDALDWACNMINIFKSKNYEKYK